MHHATDIAESTRGLRFTAGLLLFCCLAFSVDVAAGDGDIVDPATFLADAFDQDPPTPSVIWLTGEKGDAVAEILGHQATSLRQRFWQRDDRTVWILDEVGREKPITAGFVIEAGMLQEVRVLAFRETRGWEIRHEFFTRQFDGNRLDDEKRLDKDIDNITGATLSVSAMKRMARVALYLDGQVREN